MRQQDLEGVYEDALDAMRAAVQAIGGAKIVAQRLYPGKPRGQAHRDVLDALNPERERKFDIGEVIQILKWAREADFHSAKHYLDAETGYEKTGPVSPGDQVAELQKAYIDAVELQKRIMERMERLQQQGAAAALRGAK